MSATETSTAPAVQEDGNTIETKATADQTANANSETVNSEVVERDGSAVNSETVDSKETVNNDTSAVVAEETEEGGGGGGGGEAAPAQGSEGASTEPKTSFLDSFLNKSGLGKVIGGKKKKEQSAAGGAGEDNAVTEGGEKDGDKGDDEMAAGGAEGGTAEGEGVIEKAPENGEKEEEAEEKKAERTKQGEAKSTVRDLIRKPVARIFSHRSTDKKDASAAESPNQLKVRSKSLDRLEDVEALNVTIEEGTTAEDGGAEVEQKASSSSSKHMKRWHSFKKLMAQKTHKRSGPGGEEGAEVGEAGGGGDSSTLDSKGSGQKRWKLKRSWTFQGLKRDPSVVGISGKAKGSEKESSEPLKSEEEVAAVAVGGVTAEVGEEGKEEGGGVEEVKTEGGEEKEKVEGGEEEKGATTAGGGTVTHHANEIWTSFKKRVIPKSKRANTEFAPTGEEDATAAPASGEETVAEESKDGKSSKAKRSHFGRAVSLKNFILRKGKSTSVEMGEGAKEEEEAEGEGGAAEGGNQESEASNAAAATATAETNDKEVPEETPAAENEGEVEKDVPPAEEPSTVAPITNGENGCSNGIEEENATHNHQVEEEEEETTGSSPMKKSKEVGGGKDEATAKIINDTEAVNSDQKAGNV